MIEPTQADVGRKVIYTGNRYPGGQPEEGVITSFNAHTVFVRYGSDAHSKGTNREDLEWLWPRRALAEGPGTREVCPSCNGERWTDGGSSKCAQCLGAGYILAEGPGS